MDGRGQIGQNILLRILLAHILIKIQYDSLEVGGELTVLHVGDDTIQHLTVFGFFSILALMCCTCHTNHHGIHDDTNKVGDEGEDRLHIALRVIIW